MELGGEKAMSVRKAARSLVAGLTASLLTLFSVSAWAGYSSQSIPPCMDKKQVLPINNEEVLQWKQGTHNQFTARAHVSGQITRRFPNQTGHAHFEIKLGPGADDTLEVIYNLEFGALPKLQAGMTVEACGDYITSIAQSGSYPPSPSGAIIHWVHKANGKGHDSGYLVIDGKLYGYRSGLLFPIGEAVFAN